jgi:carboxylesterase type B
MEPAVQTGRGLAATFFYEFAWDRPPLGAGHSIKIPFVFNNLASAQQDELMGPIPGRT